MATWWVGQQNQATGVFYVVLQSGDNQFPSGDLPSTSEAAGPYTGPNAEAEAQAEANTLNKAPGGALGVKPAGQSQWWFYNSKTGQVIEDTDWLTAQGDMLRTKTGTGWHYYASQIDMLNAIAANNWPPPQYQNSVAQNLANAPKQVPGLPTGLAAIGDFFSRLAEGSTWIRIGEGLLGIILIAVGIARITNAVPIATKIARTVA